MEFNLAIFASGSGTNAENIIKYFQHKPAVNINLIVTNNPKAFVIERAKQFNIECLVLTKEDWKDVNKVLNKLKPYNIDFIILAGYLLRIPSPILNIYADKVINIHPALLPKYGGKGMYGDNVHKSVIANQEKESGITIHYCNENYDEGNIIFQAKCSISPSDTYETLATKVHELEYKFYPIIIEKLLFNYNIER